MDRLEMGEILRDFNVIFDKFKASPEVVDLWTQIFSKYDYETVKKAALRVAETSQYAPKPADLKAAITYIKDTQPKGGDLACTPEELAEYRAVLGKNGIVVLPNGDYARRQDVHGTETKIDYVCRVLGHETVTNMLREALGGYRVNPKKYREFLNTVLIPMAEQDEHSKFNDFEL